jgi:hypothetical protein
MTIAVDRMFGFFRSRSGVWLAATLGAVALSAGSFMLGRASVPAPQALGDASDMDSYADDASSAPQSPPRADNDTAPVSAPARRAHAHAGEPEGAAVIAAATKASGLRYVHRMNSDVRAEPSYAAQVLKKEPKGAQVQLLALSDKWAEIQDGAVKGWMRASILKDTPPDTDSRRKKKSDE